MPLSESDSHPIIVELLPWQRPQVQHLIITLNTGLRGASIEDDGDLGPAQADLLVEP